MGFVDHEKRKTEEIHLKTHNTQPPIQSIVQYLVIYVRQYVNMCLQVSVQRATAFHIPLVSFFIRLFTSRAEYGAVVGGSE